MRQVMPLISQSKFCLMVPHIQISPLAPNNIADLNKLVNSAYRGETSKKGWTTEADLLDGLRTDEQSLMNLIKHPDSIILQAVDEDDRLVGCVYLQQRQHQLYLGMLTVSPDIQAKGIGKQLLLAAEAYAKEKNCDTVIMTVIDIRHELIDWYKRKGYKKTGENKPFPADPAFGIPKQPLQFIVLEKKL